MTHQAGLNGIHGYPIFSSQSYIVSRAGWIRDDDKDPLFQHLNQQRMTIVTSSNKDGANQPNPASRAASQPTTG